MKEEKFSIIIPTMWKYQPFVKFLGALVKHDLVGEVIIINNNHHSTPNSSILNNEKIKMFNFYENIFVNPAWNFGVSASQFNKLCILNDDVIFDIKVFSRILDLLVPGTMFAVNLPWDHPNPPQIVTGRITLTKWDREPGPYHFGCLMFVHKDDWVQIPAGLNVYYGDSWIWDSMRVKYQQTYAIEDLFLSTPTNTTGATLSNREHIYSLETEFVKKYWPFLMENLSKQKLK